MLLRRLLGVLFLITGLIIAVPVIAQDKDKDKDSTAAKDKDKDKDAKDKDSKDKDKKDKDKDVKDKDKTDKSSKEEPKGKATLAWKFEKGKALYQKMSTETTQNMKVMNQPVDQKQKQTFYFSYTPAEQKGDEWVITQKIEGVSMDIDIGNQKISYDSTKGGGEANNPLADFFKALVGSEFKITLNTKDMTVTKLEGRQEFVDKLTKANPQMKPLLEQILSEKALMQMAEPTFAALPGGEKSVGDKWTKKTALDMGPIGKYDNEYTYAYAGKDDKDKSLDKITVDTVLKYTPPTEAAGTASSNLPFKIKSADLKSTKATGSILYKDGRIDKSTMELNLEGKLSIEIGGQATDVELKQTQTSTVETSGKPQIEKK